MDAGLYSRRKELLERQGETRDAERDETDEQGKRKRYTNRT
jgi:hypothetical protein